MKPAYHPRRHLFSVVGATANNGDFTRAIPWPEQPQYDAFHTAEVPYVFANPRLLKRPWETLDHQLAAHMSAYWVNFFNQYFAK